MQTEELEGWLAAYGRAWETKDPQAAAALFTEDATYRETPFHEVMAGRESVEPDERFPDRRG